MATHTCPDVRKGVADCACSKTVTAQWGVTVLLPDEWDELLTTVGEIGISGARGKKGDGGDRGSAPPRSLRNERRLPTMVYRKRRSEGRLKGVGRKCHLRECKWRSSVRCGPSAAASMRLVWASTSALILQRSRSISLGSGGCLTICQSADFGH